MVVVVADDGTFAPGTKLLVVVGIVTTGKTGKGAKVGAIVAKVCVKKGLWVVVVVVVVNGGTVKDLKLGVVWNMKGVAAADLIVKKFLGVAGLVATAGGKVNSLGRPCGL